MSQSPAPLAPGFVYKYSSSQVVLSLGLLIMTPEHIAYVKAELAKGITEDDLRDHILKYHYTPESIDEIFAAVENANNLPRVSPAPSVTYPAGTAQVSPLSPNPEQPTSIVSENTTEDKGLTGLIVLGVALVLFVLIAAGGFYYYQNYMVDSVDSETQIESEDDDDRSSVLDSRKAGADAALKSSLNNLRVQAELHYDRIGSYAGFCDEEQFFTTAMFCISAAEAYTVSAELSDGKAYCVDNTGFAGVIGGKPDGLSCSS